MILSRRTFISGLVVAAVTPAIAKLIPETTIEPPLPPRVRFQVIGDSIITFKQLPIFLYGDGVNDDSLAIKALLLGKPVTNISPLSLFVAPSGEFMLSNGYMYFTHSVDLDECNVKATLFNLDIDTLNGIPVFINGRTTNLKHPYKQ